MQFIRYTCGGSPQWGVVQDDWTYDLSVLPESPPSFVQMGNESYLGIVRSALESNALERIETDEIKVLAPVPRPGKIVCVGLNYHDHAEEAGDEPPEAPMLFSKAPTTVTNPGSPINHPTDVNQVDYEVELAAVVGQTAKYVDATDALDYLAGYTIINDVSARDAQFADSQFYRGKSYDTFSPMGPVIATGTSLDPNDLAVSLRLNAKTMQSSRTTKFIFGMEEIVSYVSRVMTLLPGDVISTGTPAGVGVFRDPPELLEPGDIVEAEIEAIGKLKNPVVKASR